MFVFLPLSSVQEILIFEVPGLKNIFLFGLAAEKNLSFTYQYTFETSVDAAQAKASCCSFHL